MHRTKVKVVEDALDANNTIAQANRADFDRHGVSVVNLMSAPGAGKTTLLERGLDGLEGVRAAVLARVRQPDMPCARCRALRAGLRSARAADVCAQLMPAELNRFIARHYPDRLLRSRAHPSGAPLISFQSPVFFHCPKFVVLSTSQSCRSATIYIQGTLWMH